MKEITRKIEQTLLRELSVDNCAESDAYVDVSIQCRAGQVPSSFAECVFDYSVRWDGFVFYREKSSPWAYCHIDDDDDVADGSRVISAALCGALDAYLARHDIAAMEMSAWMKFSKGIVAALRLIRDTHRAGVANLQRHLMMGYNSASKMMKALERLGVVKTVSNAGRIEILMDDAALDQMIARREAGLHDLRQAGTGG